jgi:lipid-A-disaccharide synthase-like uncharacterized protein
VNVVEAVGWAGQGLYFGRGWIQWLASERAKRIVVPSLYWWLSLIGAVLSLVYAVCRFDLVFTLATAAPLPVYVRNLHLSYTRRRLGNGALLSVGVGVLLGAALAFWKDLGERLVQAPWGIAAAGIAGTALWTARFPYQWWISEKLGRSSLPTGFFLISFLGSACLLAYAIWTGIPVFIAGQALGPLLYGRGLVLARRYAVRSTEAPSTAPSPAQP